jgi:hypothetical protein
MILPASAHAVRAWRGHAFDDADWTPAPLPIGYGDGPYGTSMADMRYNYSSIMLRTTLDFPQAAAVRGIQLRTRTPTGSATWKSPWQEPT